MGNAFLYNMPLPPAGSVTRESVAHIEGQVLGATPFPAFGLFAKMVTGKAVPIGSGDLAAAVYGLLIRPFPQTGGAASDPIGTSTPPASGIGNILRRGYATVKVNAGVAAQGTQVYIRVADAAPGQPIGGIEAAADSTDTIAVTGAKFTGPADADGIAEIEYNI